MTLLSGPGPVRTDGAEVDPAGLADVVAAGTVPYRRTATGGLEVAVVHRPRYDDWSLPKGHQDPGEPLTRTALRETAEEAGLDCRLGGRLGHVSYPVAGKGLKVVHYWAAEVVHGDGFSPAATGPGTDPETDELRWVSPAEAGTLLDHAHDAELVGRLDEVGTPASTVLLVRHAKAGSRSSWTGDDDQRPLSGTGHTQADRLAGFLPRFGPDRLAAAPPLRCVQTIEPLAEKTGLGGLDGRPGPSVEPLLGERDYWERPDAGVARFRELAARPGVTLVCSQGGVIPDVVARLLDEADAGTAGVPSHKASTWVLGFDDAGALLFGDYYRRPPA